MGHSSKDALRKVVWVIVNRMYDAVQLTGRLLKQLPVNRRGCSAGKGRIFLIIEGGHGAPDFVRCGGSWSKLKRSVATRDRNPEQGGQLERLLLPWFGFDGDWSFRSPAGDNREASCSCNCQRRLDYGG